MRVGSRFCRVETRRTASKKLAGMVSELPNKDCWTLAEHAGDTSPDAMQHLLSAAGVDEDGLRDDLRDYVLEHLGSAGAVLVVDESGDLKKGTKTVGVQRQYTGTAGRIENSQVAGSRLRHRDRSRVPRHRAVPAEALDHRPRPLRRGRSSRRRELRHQTRVGAQDDRARSRRGSRRRLGHRR
ncbi:transposase [Nocardia sputi]|uniref:transposase n=1 Tax=Nocardia TaxID=1817 RepID=UPI0034E2BDED